MLFVDRYTFQQSHPFFEQALQIFAAVALHHLIISPGQPELWIKDGDYRLELHNLDEFEACIRESRIPSEISIRPTFWTEWFPEEAEQERIANPPKPLIAGELMTTAAIFGLSYAYESHREWLVQQFGSTLPGRWPADMQLFRHIRNGCSHNNHFDIRLNRDGSEPIDTASPPTWEILTLTSRSAMSGKKVVGEFLQFSLVLPFLHDIGQRLIDLGWAPNSSLLPACNGGP